MRSTARQSDSVLDRRRAALYSYPDLKTGRAVDSYIEYDGTGLAQLAAKGEVTSGELLDAAVSRAERLNPALNAITVWALDAAREAAAAPARGPMRGVPSLLKDLGAEAKAYPATNGANLYKDIVHKYDSEIYLRLKAAGLVFFGRTASPEFGIGPVTEAGANGAPTRNPWNTDRTPGGSSGGSAAAVAAGIVPAAHGSDGGGSVRIPASNCGLVGFKPTRARLPDGPGAGEGWAGMAIDGVLTRSLRDTAVLLDAAAGPDLGAPYWPPPMAETYQAAMTQAPGALRIGFLTASFTGAPVHAECRTAVERTAGLLETLGHHVEPFTAAVDVEPMMKAWTKIVACGAALSVHAKSADPEAYEPKIDGVTRGAVRLAAGISGADYLAAVQTVHAFGRRMARAFENIDVLMTPTMAESPAEIGRFAPVNEDFMDYRNGPEGVFAYSPFTAVFNASGQPAVSLPLHWSADNLPVGVQFAAAFGGDALLMRLAAQLEHAAPWSAKQIELMRSL